jgi:AGZA family xanthine/uracil permease-like MFS transporter
MKVFVKGDIDGFIALWLDNLVVAIVMAKLSLGFPLFLEPHLFYSRLLPASAAGLIIGNCYYAWQARRLARREGRADVCSLPFGLSIILLVTFVFLIMYPAKVRAEAAGLSGADASMAAWRAGVGAAFIMGLVELAGSFAAAKIRRFTPRPALLAALAGIGLAFLSLDFFFRAYATSVVGLTTLGLTFLFYFGRVELRINLPRGLVVLVVGTALAWGSHFLIGSTIVPVGEFTTTHLGWHWPRPDPALLLTWWGTARESLPVVIPLGLISTLWSLQSIESAEAAGDRYDTRSSLFFNGVATMGSALFGSPFLATIYFGHPGWKAIGARSGYSVLNAVAMTLVCFTGTLSWIIYAIPVEAGMALITWIGIATATQAFEVVPKRHIPAVVVGLIPALAAFTELVVKRTLLAVGVGTAAHPLPADLNALFVARADFYSAGVFALAEGYIYTCMIWSATTVHIIDRNFKTAAAWFAIAGGLSLVGLVHNYIITPADVVGIMGWQPNATTLAYFLLAALCFGAGWYTRPCADSDGATGAH